MPRSKHQKHHHWDIDDPYQELDEPRRIVRAYAAIEGVAQPTAVAELIRAGYEQLVSSIPLTPVRRVQRNGDGRGAAPRPANRRAGGAGLRVDGNRDGTRHEHSGPPLHPSPESEAA
mgnify:CR=1 FL=1